MNKNFPAHKYYKPSASTQESRFTISHYAGQVTYDARDWLEKNRDTLPPGVMEMLQASQNALVRSIFKGRVLLHVVSPFSED